jgi:contact-dependent growth inhibition (CDI) system CdiI-like immunity protein
VFDIHLTDECVADTDPGVTAIYGKIHIGDHVETFVSSLVCWGRVFYERHWDAATRRLLTGATRSALITSYVEPGLSNRLIWWPLHREGDVVYVQNQMLFYDQLSSRFSIDEPWESVPERRTTNVDGLEISEWKIGIRDIQAFWDHRAR